MKITLTVYPRTKAKGAAKKLAANAGIHSKRVRDAEGKLVTVRTLDVGNKSFGKAFNLIFRSNVSKAIATKKASKTASVGKRSALSKS